MTINLNSFKTSWRSVAPLTCGLVAIATPAQAASFAFAESLLEINFSQDFFNSETDGDVDLFSNAEDGDVETVGEAAADILVDISDSPVCLFSPSGPGACNVAFSEVEGDDGNSYFGTSDTRSEVVGDFFVASGDRFGFDFIASLLLETGIERPNVESVQATGEVSLALFGGTQKDSLSLLESFTLAANLSTLGADDSLTLPETSAALTFGTFADSSFGGTSEFVDVLVAGSYDWTFDTDTHLRLVEVKTSSACSSATFSNGKRCTPVVESTEVPEPSSAVALMLPALGLAGRSLKKRIKL